MFAAFVLAAVVHGRVVFEQEPVPGVEVTLGTSRVRTDIDGRYTFNDIVPGRYDIEYKLDGFYTERESLFVRAGDDDLRDRSLSVIRTMVADDNKSPCETEHAEKWGFPWCSDYELDGALEKAMTDGDRSAVRMLQQRYETQSNVLERLRIAGMLLRHVDDDSKYWNDVVHFAEDALRFGGHEEALKAFCAKESIEPSDYDAVLTGAFMIASEDRRSNALMRRALESHSNSILVCAVVGLAAQRDESALQAIDMMLEREGDNARDAAFCLADYRTEAADAIAAKYLHPDDRDSYATLRKLRR